MNKLPKLKRKTSVATQQISNPSLLQRVQSEMKLNQSYLNLVLGLLIVLVAGILVLNYFKKNQTNLGPAQNTSEQNQANKDVDPANLPGKYTVKEGDTLFKIAQAYYNDGYKFPKLAEVNKIANSDNIEAGLVLEIPKLEETQQAAVTATESTTTNTTASDTTSTGTGGAINQTIWGESITGDTYTVVEGDWLSKIAGRAYGDIMAFDKIAKANNISNPDVIEPGTVLKIPR